MADDTREETGQWYPERRPEGGACDPEGTRLGRHLEDFGNPHRVTAEQVGTLAETVIRRLVEAAARGAVDEAKAYADLLASGLLRLCGVVDSVEDLPDVAVNGNVYIVRADNSEYLWLADEQRWERLGPILDLSGYATQAWADARYPRLSGIGSAGAVTNKGALRLINRDAQGTQYPALRVGSQFTNGLATGDTMREDRQCLGLFWDRLEFQGAPGAALRVLSFKPSQEDSLMRKDEMDGALAGYLPLTGGTVTGDTTIMGTRFTNSGWLFASNIAEGGLWISAKYAAKAHTHDAADIASGTINAARLPAATAGMRGAVAAGDGLKMGGNANAVMSVKPATASTLGGVKVGDGLTIAADGTLSTTGGGGDTEVYAYEGYFYVKGEGEAGERQIVLSDDLVDGTIRLFSRYKSNGEWVEDTYSMNTRLATQAYVDEHAAVGDSLSVLNAQAHGLIVNGVRVQHDTEVYPFLAGVYLDDTALSGAFAVRADGTPGVYIDLVWHPFTADLFADKSYTLPAATATTLGGVKVGDGLSVADDGTLSATGGGDWDGAVPYGTALRFLTPWTDTDNPDYLVKFAFNESTSNLDVIGLDGETIGTFGNPDEETAFVTKAYVDNLVGDISAALAAL